MYRLRNYDNPVQAQQAAVWLMRHGVLAVVVGDHVSALGPYAGFTSRHGVGSFTVAIALERQRETAGALIERFDAEPASYDEGWEDGSLPDLARLDPALLPDCPGCAQSLPPDAALDACPRCGRAVDVAGLIAAAHGPEVLEPLLADPNAGADADTDPIPDWITDEVLDAVAADCPACGYPLDGLAHAGVCPECAMPYDKRAILEALMREATGDEASG